MVKKYLLTSLFGCILATTLLFFSISINIVLCLYYNQVGIFPIIISFLFVLFTFLGTFLCFYESIKIDLRTNKVIVKNFKSIIIDLEKIHEIKISTENSVDSKKYCNIIFVLNDKSSYTIHGFNSILKFRDVKKTIDLVNELNKVIKFENKK